jgi:outer membrane protein assembly factor BamA
MGVLFGTIVVLAMPAVEGQTAAGIHLAAVRFSGNPHLPGVNLSKCASDLRSQIYEGPEWLADITNRVQLLCLKEEGYFKAFVRASTEQLPDKHETHQFAVTFTIESGPQYRTGQISFRNNRVFSEQQLRAMFKLAPGEIFRIIEIQQGLDHIHSAYVERRYLNFTSIPNTIIDDSGRVISLVIECHEGNQSQ